MKPILAPSILAADFGNLQRDIEMLNQSEADWIHVDIMDGVYVPEISFGIPVCQAVQKHAMKPLDVHLMVVNPELHLESYKNAGASNLTVHAEACTHLHKVIQQIKSLECKAGVALNPHTNVNVLDEVLEELDLVLIMSVNPGYGGQSFIKSSLRKIEKLKNNISNSGSKALIEVDGGVSNKNIGSLLDAGTDIIVAGSFVFRSEDPAKTIRKLKGSYSPA